jgi:hypothetical protein
MLFPGIDDKFIARRIVIWHKDFESENEIISGYIEYPGFGCMAVTHDDVSHVV